MSKNKSQLITKAQRLFIAMLAFLPWLPASADDARPPKPPFFVPFEAQKAGSVFTTELRVVEHRSYKFALFLKPKKGGTKKDAKQLLELAGGFERDRNGKPIRTGISIPLKLKVSVIDTSGDRVIYEKEIYKEEVLGGGGMGIEKLIDTIELRPGRYRISVQSLKDIPELADTPINFSILNWPNSNPID